MDEPAQQFARSPLAPSRSFVLALVCLLLSAYAFHWALTQKTVIGATVDVLEPASGFVLKARVDTGASISSLHCVDIKIERAFAEPAENSGKKVRFLLEGPGGKQHWLESTILGFSGVRSAAGTSNRYRVRLKLTCAGVTKESIVSLNDRSEMKYPLLLGRDFLEDDFIVDVSRDNPDYP